MANQWKRDFAKQWEPCWELIGRQFDELAEQVRNDIPDLKVYRGSHSNIGGGLFSGFMNLRNPLSLREGANLDGFEIVVNCWLRQSAQSYLEIECDTQFNPGPILSEIVPIIIPLDSSTIIFQERLDAAADCVRKFIAEQHILAVSSLQ